MMRKRMYAGVAPKRSVKKAKTVAQKVSRLQRQVALLKPELKHFTATAVLTNITHTSGGIVNLTAIVQGAGTSDRIGDVIRAQTIEVVLAEGSVASGKQIRFIIVKDTQNAGVIPVVSGVGSSVLTTAAPSTAMLAPTARPRYKVLYDEIHMHSTAVYGAYTSEIRRCGFQLNFPIHFIGNAAVDYGKNTLWLIALTDDTAGTMDVTAAYDIGFTDV